MPSETQFIPLSREAPPRSKTDIYHLKLKTNKKLHTADCRKSGLLIRIRSVAGDQLQVVARRGTRVLFGTPPMRWEDLVASQRPRAEERGPTGALGSPPASTRLTEARLAFEAGEYARVVELLASARDREALKLRSRALYELGRYHEARSVLMDLRDDDPADPWPHVLFGLIDLTDDKPSWALNDLDRAVELTRREDPHALFYRGVARFRTGQLVDAEEDFRAAQRLVDADTDLSLDVARFLDLIRDRLSVVPPATTGVVLQAIRGDRHVSLSDLRHQTIVVHLWAPQTSSDSKALAPMARFFEQNRKTLSERGISLLVVGVETSRSELASFVDRSMGEPQSQLPLYWDSEGVLHQLYGWGESLPATVVVQPNGRSFEYPGLPRWSELGIVSGSLTDARTSDDLEAKIRELKRLSRNPNPPR